MSNLSLLPPLFFLRIFSHRFQKSKKVLLSHFENDITDCYFNFTSSSSKYLLTAKYLPSCHCCQSVNFACTMLKLRFQAFFYFNPLLPRKQKAFMASTFCQAKHSSKGRKFDARFNRAKDLSYIRNMG
jgi:hypothetical protein